jgi:hypothetical protein
MLITGAGEKIMMTMMLIMFQSQLWLQFNWSDYDTCIFFLFQLHQICR